MIKVLVSDLVLIADYMRLLKQKDAMWIGNYIVGIDNMSYIIIIPIINLDRLSIIPTKGLIFNQRELSKFMKSISIESDFEIDDSGMINTTTLTTIANETMSVKVNTAIQKVVEEQISQSINIDKQMVTSSIKPEMDVSKDLEDLYKMSKSSGIYNYIYDSNHLMTLFSGIFPLAKNDKIFCTVTDINDTSFIARFRIYKKSCNVITYLQFRRI